MKFFSRHAPLMRAVGRVGTSLRPMWRSTLDGATTARRCAWRVAYFPFEWLKEMSLVLVEVVRLYWGQRQERRRNKPL